MKVQDVIAKYENAKKQVAAKSQEPNVFKYRRSIVTFIDVLGFGNFVKTRSADEIGKVLRRLREYATEDKKFKDVPAGLVGSIAFSDCVVRVCPIDTSDHVGTLYFELISLAAAQTELAAKGVFLRGGLTIGDVYFDGDVKWTLDLGPWA